MTRKNKELSKEHVCRPVTLYDSRTWRREVEGNISF